MFFPPTGLFTCFLFILFSLLLVMQTTRVESDNCQLVILARLCFLILEDRNLVKYLTSLLVVGLHRTKNLLLLQPLAQVYFSHLCHFSWVFIVYTSV